MGPGFINSGNSQLVRVYTQRMSLLVPCTILGRRSVSALTSKQAVGLSGRGRNVRRLTTNSNVEPSSSSGESVVATPTPRHVLSSYERFVVRITRSYSGTDIPTTMGPEAMDRINSRFRIGLMVVMMVFTLGMSLYAIRQGKREKAAGSSEMVYAKNRSRYK